MGDSFLVHYLRTNIWRFLGMIRIPWQDTSICSRIFCYPRRIRPQHESILTLGPENQVLSAPLIIHIKSKSFLTSVSRYYTLSSWTQRFDHKHDIPTQGQWSNIWAELTQVWIASCERERVMWWEDDCGGGGVHGWLDWVFRVRCVFQEYVDAGG